MLPSANVLQQGEHESLNPGSHGFPDGSGNRDLVVRFNNNHVSGDGAGGDAKVSLDALAVQGELCLRKGPLLRCQLSPGVGKVAVPVVAPCGHHIVANQTLRGPHRGGNDENIPVSG